MPEPTVAISTSNSTNPRRAYPHVLKFVTETPWAIVPEKLEAIADVLTHRLMNAPLTPRAFEDDEDWGGPSLKASTPAALYQVVSNVAVIPMIGVVAKRMNLFSEISGGTSIEKVSAAFRMAMADPAVSAIVLQIDSPGGSVYGVEELGDLIFEARGNGKRIVAQADDLAASAAYWIASQADELVVTPSGEVGSVGVVAMHVDYSGALEQEGIKVTFIHAGANKVEGNAYEPLADDARAFIQTRIDDYYRSFTDAVARGRGVTAATVRKDFGQGRVYGSDQAKKLGMVSRIGTLAETIDRLQQQRPRTKKAQAAAHADMAQAINKAT